MKRVFLGLIVILIIAAAASGFWCYRQLQTPHTHAKQGTYIEIARGSSPTAILNRLESEGVIANKWPLTFYLKATGRDAQLKAGEYDFPSPISPMGVLEKLREGQQRLIRLTVVEGWTRWDIANAMTKIPQLQIQNSDEILKLMDNVKLISDLDPMATNLEGYLFPDTYEFPPDTKAPAIIEIMVKRFRKEWKPDWSAQAIKLNRTPREIVTIASLIETEAKLPDERPIVASVIYNRLAKDMALGVDSSIIYASKLAGKWRNDGKVYKSDVDRRSPYNTRIYSGLPPGPIAAPGKSCLEAALNPAQTDYLYYVREPARDDGAHNFYNDEASFGRGVRALREWEVRRDAEAAKVGGR